MRQRLAIIITIAIVLGLLIALNAASYVRIEQSPDSEFKPDRSTYNSGATGTRALFDFLNETGRKVARWREAPSALLNSSSAARPTTFVVIGKTIVPFEDAEAESLLRWVERGGRLVIIDRLPNARLLPPSAKWRVSTELLQYPTEDAPSDNPEAMTAGVSLAHPAQPTVLTRDVDSVMPSRFASLIWVHAEGASVNSQTDDSREALDEDGSNDEDFSDENDPAAAPPSPPAPATTASAGRSPAPLVHLADYRGAMLVDYAHGAGHIVLLSDPFIVANNGISRADNLQLALNVIASTNGIIAFDEYHQGRRATRNQLFAYFAGTPVLAMIAQLVLIILIVLWTRGRRFARPLPLPRVDRRSSLEFVASMAELQQRSRAFDLAIENIYARTRRALVRYAGVEANAPRTEIAARVAARSKLDGRQLEALMRDCEDAINGGPVDARKSLALVHNLRETERALGLRMRSREIRQAKENKG